MALLTYLGDAFSSETSREREHLHFGIYKGVDLYFRGHEKSVSELENKIVIPIPAIQPQKPQETSNLWGQLRNLLVSIKGFFMGKN
ncbi:MAG: hypothetical protein UV74_C0001G0047 [Candidatus Woesebacteria bacterium GW2011_GWB1_43_14]|uniref:Uncharacterized protein n=1 Tax=Candidatus Woesebacteria bacterium GW2011_GWB1_43_14 TaxID=1618578 RepID=A0A0G1DMY5_9BACT|nr:MAG: hypothetical protein UV51_C0002G0036 [Candidatus Woesebacteria bacterium GW2011_GWC1_42_9]KKS98937.1 MAG: hypothetical protein UV74_C0001G0047 [Candidatus Woesebacteria bacterium GW2011_GWB1_43_14]